MKRGCPEHPKTLDLAARLNRPRRDTVGLLELLFHFTAQYAPEGNIGRYSNKRIAAALDWTADPDRLLSALIASGWVDQDPVHRLITHDWKDHCDRTTLQRLSRRGKLPLESPNQATHESILTERGMTSGGNHPPVEINPDGKGHDLGWQPGGNRVATSLCQKSENQLDTEKVCTQIGSVRVTPPVPVPVPIAIAIAIPPPVTSTDDGFDFPAWFESLYALGPKKGFKHQARGAMATDPRIADQDFRREIETGWKLWAEYMAVEFHSKRTLLDWFNDEGWKDAIPKEVSKMEYQLDHMEA